ncbi:disease resistance protein RPS6-like [Quercus lobata]|uniref:disease resistance protein RPS6-like n=1 Tax=Quercus lobata TaxID=97700 RepID=UPI0012441707|nr:disease resistance protein RPS6-like [Quercus lobata]
MDFLTNEGASSSFSTPQWIYDVFLSFGEDTRNNFTGYLYEALCYQGFNTFIDNDLQKGEEISMELHKVIESSMISIVVFSKSFASSTWCLNELVKIFECRSNGQLVLPIFYKVNPSEIRKQDGEFGIALAEHEEKFKDDREKVQKWRKTLTEAANLSGFHYNDSCTKSEFEFIQRVIKEISSAKSNQLFVAKHPVGIDIRAEAIELLLDIESNDVCMVGICGSRGIGKTTISKVVYNSIANHFEGSCFLENVSEMSITNGGIIQLQEKLLSKVLQGRDLKVQNVFEDSHLSMHDLLQQMGREIVQQESEQPEQRSRIWHFKDAHKLLTGNMGSNKIRGIMLRSPEPTKVALKANVFKRMKNLKFLIGNVHIGEDLEYLPDELRFLEWHEFPLSLSSKCCVPEELVALKMSKSNIILEKVFKQGFQYENLKMINLRSCEFITKLPDLCCPNLEKLDLQDCKNLIKIHESIGFLEKLKVWTLRGCSQLQILPNTLMLKSLGYFDLNNCSRLEKFSDIHPEMKCLKKLFLGHSGIRELPSSLLYLTELDTLELPCCRKLTKFLVIPSAELRPACNSFNNFLGPTGYLSLTKLDLTGCVRIKVELDSWMQADYFPILTDLVLDSTSIVTIPESISRFTRLQYLSIRYCRKLREIPRLPKSIRTVVALYCYRLDPQSSSRLWNQFGEILGILPNTVAEAARSFESKIHCLVLPAIEIPRWFKFNHHQSVGDSVSFLVGPKFSNLVVCIAFPSKDENSNMENHCFIDISINGVKQSFMDFVNYGHVWLIYGKVNISNPSEENRIKVEVRQMVQIRSKNTMRIYVECICCPASSMDQWAFNNREEDSGHVGIRHRLQRRNHRSTHARHPQKHYLSRFGWLRIRFQLWKRSSKPWRQ